MTGVQTCALPIWQVFGFHVGQAGLAVNFPGQVGIGAPAIGAQVEFNQTGVDHIADAQNDFLEFGSL